MTDFRIMTVEEQIIRGIIAAMLAENYELSVNDGEEITLKRSRDPEAIFAAMRTTDEDYLIIHTPGSGYRRDGWVFFVYGNEDHEVVNDYTTNLERIMAPINAEIDKLF